MSGNTKVQVLRNLTDGESYRVEIVGEVRAQVGKRGDYAVPFQGVGKGFDPNQVGNLLALFSSDPFELYRLVKVLMSQDETGQVKDSLAADLNE